MWIRTQSGDLVNLAVCDSVIKEDGDIQPKTHFMDEDVRLKDVVAYSGDNELLLAQDLTDSEADILMDWIARPLTELCIGEFLLTPYEKDLPLGNVVADAFLAARRKMRSNNFKDTEYSDE